MGTRRTSGMATTKEADTTQTVVAPRRHRLEMETCLVESSIDDLESSAQHIAGVEGDVSYIITHGKTCYSVSQICCTGRGLAHYVSRCPKRPRTI